MSQKTNRVSARTQLAHEMKPILLLNLFEMFHSVQICHVRNFRRQNQGEGSLSCEKQATVSQNHNTTIVLL